MESLTDEQRAEIDSSILVGDIIAAVARIKAACGVGLRDAIEINRARYQHLRAERAAEFVCDDEEYWTGYAECLFDAIGRGL